MPMPATEVKQPTVKDAPVNVIKQEPIEIHEPRSFLATFLLTTVFAPLGLRHFYLGDKKLGWIRVGLFCGGLLWMVAFSSLQIISFTIVGWLAFMVAVVWGAVDFFYVYCNVRRDAYGKSLIATTLDKKFATVIFWSTIILAAGMLIIGLAGLGLERNRIDQWSQSAAPMPEFTAPGDQNNLYY